MVFGLNQNRHNDAQLHQSETSNIKHQTSDIGHQQRIHGFLVVKCLANAKEIKQRSKCFAEHPEQCHKAGKLPHSATI